MAVLVVVGVVAAAVRLRFLTHPTPFYYGTYDDGVYFTEALRFVHGLLPYRDGVFLQPPGIVLSTAPFALLASVLGDAHAFVIARGAYAMVGAVNAVLVAACLRRTGLVAALAGGLVYALAWQAVYVERSVGLEVLGTTGIVTSVLLLQRSGRGRWLPLLAGAAAAVSIDMKVWYVALFAVLAVFAWRRAPWFLLGGAITGLACYLPFFLAAPAAMWRQVVTAQLGRPHQHLTVGTRVRSMLGLDEAAAGRPWWQLAGASGVLVLALLLVVVVILSLTMRDGRLFVALLVVSGLVLLLSPSYLQHYATLTAAPIALVAGAGAGRIVILTRRRWTALPVLALTAVVAAGAYLAPDLGLRAKGEGLPAKVLPIAALKSAAAAVHGCLVSDDPTVLLLMNRLSSDLDRGCDVQADPSGVGYVLTTPGKAQVRRQKNPLWQREIVRYLHSADAYLLVRGPALGLSPASHRLLDRDPVIARVQRFTIRQG